MRPIPSLLFSILAGLLILVFSSLGHAIGPLPAQTPPALQGDCHRFEQTTQQVCGRFLEYWSENGGLAQQGYPISAAMQERSDTDGTHVLLIAQCDGVR